VVRSALAQLYKTEVTAAAAIVACVSYRTAITVLSSRRRRRRRRESRHCPLLSTVWRYCVCPSVRPSVVCPLCRRWRHALWPEC